MFKFTLGLGAGAVIAWIAASIVFLPPADWGRDCEVAFDGVYEAERIIAKLVADFDASDRAYKARVSELCAYKGRLPRGLVTSTESTPNFIWQDNVWLMQRDGAYLPL